jgi:hypothetical protein
MVLLAQELDELFYRYFACTDNPVLCHMVQEITGRTYLGPYLFGLSPMLWVTKGINVADQVQGVKDLGCVHVRSFVMPFVRPSLCTSIRQFFNFLFACITKVQYKKRRVDRHANQSGDHEGCVHDKIAMKYPE